MNPQPIDAVTFAFPAGVKRLMPLDDPKWPEFRKAWHRDDGAWYKKLFSDAFYKGLKSLELQPREGIDPKAAWRHIRAIMGSWEPQHEDKETACHLLLDKWFTGAKWEANPK